MNFELFLHLLLKFEIIWAKIANVIRLTNISFSETLCISMTVRIMHLWMIDVKSTWHNLWHYDLTHIHLTEDIWSSLPKESPPIQHFSSSKYCNSFYKDRFQV